MDNTPPRYGPADSLASPRFSGIRTYARLPHLTDLADVDVAIVGVPFDTGGTYRVGARFGPQAIRAASALIRPYHTGSGVAVFDSLSVVDYGDVPCHAGGAAGRHVLGARSRGAARDGHAGDRRGGGARAWDGGGREARRRTRRRRQGVPVV